MKQLFRFWIVAALLLMVGCDDSALVGSVDDLESRVQRLEQLCQQMNTNISSLQTIVTALQNKDYVTGVAPITENGKTIGYTITFAKAQSITIYHGKDGQDGADGKDSDYVPTIGVKQGTDGIYYWTWDGEWLLDDAGNKIKAQGVDGKDGITPQLKIEDDYWYVSYDNGSSWIQLGKVTGEDGKDGANGKSFFQDVTQDDNNVYFTLSDGTVITVPMGLALSIEFAESDLVVMSPNSTREIGYTVTSATDTVKVEVTSSADIKAKAVADNASGMTGKIHVTTGDAIGEYSKVIVFVSNGYKVIMRSIKFEEAGLVVEENATKQASAEGGEMTLEFLSNVECEVVIPEDAQSWISVVPATRAMEKQTITLKLEPNLGANREAVVVLQNLDNSLQLEYNIVQEATIDYQLSLEREALIAFYKATEGDNWKSIWGHTDVKNENWCSDKPVYEWYGVRVNDDGNVIELRLPGCNLYGKIPPEIKNLTKLEVLQLNSNNLEGELPKELLELKQLKVLDLMTNWFSGNIPEEIGNLSNLRELKLHQNLFTGPIPESLVKLSQLEDLMLCENTLSGSLPNSFYDWDFWSHWWGLSLKSTKYRFEDIVLPGPKAIVTCLNGKTINLEEEYGNNKYTILFQWYTEGWETEYILPQMQKIQELYADKGVKIIGWANSNLDSKDSAIQYIEKSEMLWDNFYYNYSDFNFTHNYDNLENTFGVLPWYPANYTTSITVVDSSGKIIFSDLFNLNQVYRNEGYFISLLENEFKNKTDDLYESTDFSQDGKVVTLQTATKGKGIDIILMGDAYSDRLIADGTYQKDMEFLFSQIFVEEPYKSFKDYFNVYYVVAVSENEIYVDHSDTAFEGFFGNQTLVGGNDNTCFTYAQMALSNAKRLNEATVIVLMNSDNYAGTCYMYYPDNSAGYGNGVSVSYFPRGGSAETFAQLLHHEACGHGFAKLADEYAYEDMGAAPSDYVSQVKTQQNNWGWWKNVDFTGDPAATLWSKFINDTRYANEGLGAYEGGLTYWTGVWRPTENSIMRYNTGGFNAPSREAIYYRIHKLAYGEDWVYDYEDFVEWDARNRATAATRAMVYKPANYRPTHPPVIVNKSWKDAK